VRGAKVKGFSRLGDGDDVSSFPYLGKVSGVYGQIKEGGKVGNAMETKMFEMQRCRTIRTSSR
jgi:hypothetical protein